MNKTYIILATILTILIFFIVIYCYFPNKNESKNHSEVIQNSSEVPDNEVVLDTEGNHMIISTKSTSTIRVINKYDANMFKNTSKKSILIMWGSWCNNCAEEFDDIEKAVKYYKNSDVNIVLIAHEFDVNDLISFLESKQYDFDTEILLDLGRVIRAALDPEASTVPIAYVLDEKGKVINKHDGALTFEDIQNIIKSINR